MLVPALIFHSLATTTIGGETLAKVVVGVVCFLLAMVALAEGVGRLLREADPTKSALVLASTSPNSGNYGIPLSEFAFGGVGRATAVLFLAARSVVIYTLGVYIASRGSGERGLGAITAVLKLPLVYAVFLAIVARTLGVVPPVESTAMETLQLVGDSSIPLMLLLVWIELAGADHGATLTGSASRPRSSSSPRPSSASASRSRSGSKTRRSHGCSFSNAQRRRRSPRSYW